MMKTIKLRNIATSTVAVLTLVISLIGSTTVSANHAWGKYHWDLSTADTKANPLKLGNNLTTPEWDSSLIGASTDWNNSVLLNEVVLGTTDPSSCSPTSGQVEVCNSEYGNNGWLGIAQIWASRRGSHITQGTVLLNDTYFNTAPYNTNAWRNLVTCQEIGHTFGLGHQDENFNNPNLGSCMDYTSDPDGSILGQANNEHPNDHDFAMLESIYGHLNSTDSGSGGSNGGGNGNGRGKPAEVGANIDLTDPSSWGQAVKQDALGNNSVYEKVLNNGTVIVTHVTWIN